MIVKVKFKDNLARDIIKLESAIHNLEFFKNKSLLPSEHFFFNSETFEVVSANGIKFPQNLYSFCQGYIPALNTVKGVLYKDVLDDED